MFYHLNYKHTFHISQVSFLRILSIVVRRIFVENRPVKFRKSFVDTQESTLIILDNSLTKNRALGLLQKVDAESVIVMNINIIH